MSKINNNSQQHPVVVTAIPEASPSSQQPAAQAYVANVSSEPISVEAHVVRPPRTDLERVGLENETIGVCRRCRRQFARPLGVHDGNAAYYRCPECVGIKAEDIIASCIIS